MGARQQLGDALIAALPATAKIVIDYRDLAEISPEITGVVQIVRTRIENLGEQNQLQTFELWVVDPHVDPTLAEDSLEANLDAVVEALAGLDWLLWQTAERTLHPSGKYEAYKIAVLTKSHITT